MRSEAEIVQIAASDLDGSNEFAQYLMPSGEISASASCITGLRVIKSGGQRRLLYKENVVEASSERDGLTLFFNYLAGKGGNVVLVAHNCHEFDMVVLSNAVNRAQLNAAAGGGIC